MANDKRKKDDFSSKHAQQGAQPVETAEDDLESVVGGVMASPGAPGGTVCVTSLG